MTQYVCVIKPTQQSPVVPQLETSDLKVWRDLEPGLPQVCFASLEFRESLRHYTQQSCQLWPGVLRRRGHPIRHRNIPLKTTEQVSHTTLNRLGHIGWRRLDHPKSPQLIEETRPWSQNPAGLGGLWRAAEQSTQDGHHRRSAEQPVLM